ncbi:DUF3021 domain-containing protein [Apilactobacillus apisilvae]|uniref:DUF3021 domain-containing protein n=1 Tax=Apilactobacillus apisilvae TaxID=2923364 RepID=A0ABY4PH26_9LACO|nr:DUF3021 family protein [Apilactobacillus apisilvae]UQS84907.1 DUF3021 domain-containing protein [Apilactobacillus apisilvae]
MKIVKRLVREFIVGMLFGSLIYMLTDFYEGDLKYRIIYLSICGLIGLLTELINSDKLKVTYAIILHFIGTFTLVSLLNIVTGQLDTFRMPYLAQYITAFLIIYVIIWLMVLSTFKNTTSKINNAIKKRNKH